MANPFPRLEPGFSSSMRHLPKMLVMFTPLQRSHSTARGHIGPWPLAVTARALHGPSGVASSCCKSIRFKARNPPSPSKSVLTFLRSKVKQIPPPETKCLELADGEGREGSCTLHRTENQCFVRLKTLHGQQLVTPSHDQLEASAKASLERINMNTIVVIWIRLYH